MADFKLGILGSELDLPRNLDGDDLGPDPEDAVEEAEMMDGTFKYNIKPHVRQTWTLEFKDLIQTECDTLNTIDGYKTTLNYINGYLGITGTTVVVAYYSGPRVIISRAGLAVPRFNATMVLKEV